MQARGIVPVILDARRSRSGFALVIVLWMIALLSVLAAGFSSAMRTEARSSLNVLESAKARALADAAVQRGLYGLLNVEPELEWRADGTPYKFSFGGADVSVSTWNEGGKVDLNAAPDELIRRLLQVLEIESAKANALADAILDWRDEDDLRRANGAERGDYIAAGVRFGPKDVPFISRVDLQHVIGLKHDIYARLANLVTVHSFAPSVNPKYAPPGVLLAVPNVNVAEVEALLSAREDKKESPYISRDGGYPVLTQVGEWVSDQASSVYTIRGEAELPSGARFAREVVIWIDQDQDVPFWVLDSRVGRFSENTEGADG